MLLQWKLWDHAIKLTPDTENKSCKVYLLSVAEQVELDKFLEENLASSRIHPLKLPMAAPFFFIRKKDGTLHPIQDYHFLSVMTVKNKYPLVLISDLLNQPGSAKYFMKFDIWWGYNNVCIKEGDKWKVVFCTNHRLYEPLIMFFRLMNSLAIFR